jgi:hypothetical protein
MGPSFEIRAKCFYVGLMLNNHMIKSGQLQLEELPAIATRTHGFFGAE